MWHKAQPNRAQVRSARPTSLAGWLGVGTILISALPTCKGGSVHQVSDAQSRWRPSWLADRPCARPVGQGLVGYRLKSIVELTHSTYKYPPYPLRRGRD
jgi:hypothetical protein